MKTYASSSGERTEYARRAMALAMSASLAAVLSIGCTDQSPVAPPLETAETPLSSAPLSVSHSEPAEGDQGETLEVRVYGDGFVDDVFPIWERDGVEDTTIVVTEVIFVSVTELRARISISEQAEIGPRDIAVVSRHKKGIGSEVRAVGEEIFTVNEYTPQALGFQIRSLWYGTVSYAFGINEQGVIVGSNYTEDRTLALYWTAAGQAIETVTDNAYAIGVNNKGWITGFTYQVGGWVFEGGALTYLEPLDGVFRTVSEGINDTGTIVGSSGKPVVWHREATGKYSSPVELPPMAVWLGGQPWYGRGMAINSRGDVVGYLRRELNPFVTESAGVLWRVRADGKTYEDPLVLSGFPRSINDAGWIVGSAGGIEGREGSWHRAVLWHPDDYSKPILLSEKRPMVQSGARGINNNGQIVGEQSQEDWSSLAILWTVDDDGNPVAMTYLLPAPGYESAEATAINDAGWIVGTSKRFYPFGYVPPPGPPIPAHEATLWRPDR